MIYQIVTTYIAGMEGSVVVDNFNDRCFSTREAAEAELKAIRERLASKPPGLWAPPEYSIVEIELR